MLCSVGSSARSTSPVARSYTGMRLATMVCASVTADPTRARALDVEHALARVHIGDVRRHDGIVSEPRFEYEVKGSLCRSTEAWEARFVGDTAQARFAGLRAERGTALRE